MSNRLATNPKLCLEGCLLVAAPQWQNELFGRSVCLVVRHSSDGAIGVFLNRSLEEDVSSLWQELVGSEPVSKQAAVHFGGPQAGPVVALHNRPDLAEYVSAEGVYFAAQRENLKALVRLAEDSAAVKIIVGQADWKAGLLDRQFAEGKWLPVPVSSKLVFAEQGEMWGQAIRGIGNQFVVSITGSSGQPENVLAN